MDKIVLSYYDSLLRESDVALLDVPHWINDKLIGFYFEYLERQYSDKSISFVTPDVTQFIKLYQSHAELEIFLSPLNLHEKDLVILGVNNNSSMEESGGSHWSTLVFSRHSCSFHHYDSLSPSNQFPAKQCAKNLTPFLCLDKGREISFIEEVCSSQENSYDCGVYAMLYAQLLCELKCNDSILKVSAISLEQVVKWREDMKTLIYGLAKENNNH